ncbi:MAG: hypothetical protein SGI99_07755 [Pseudomonadota bacterium]|nr:hypothetical protein [Pseudomonadota bacterium]
MPIFLAEFLYSAILWGSLITALLWWLRSRAASRVMRGMLWIPMAWFGLHTAFAWYGFILPPSGTLIDADAGTPYARQRVIATWMSYPLSLWSTACSGSQAHLTDAEGDFAFRFAPAPTLVFGSLARGLRSMVPGRINQSKMRGLLVPLLGKQTVQRYVEGRSLSRQGESLQCAAYIAPQYPDTVQPLPGEADPFAVMLREACVEKQPWTQTDIFMFEMMRVHPSSPAPPIDIQNEYGNMSLLGCQEGICVGVIAPHIREKFCGYFTSLQSPVGAKP